MPQCTIHRNASLTGRPSPVDASLRLCGMPAIALIIVPILISGGAG